MVLDTAPVGRLHKSERASRNAGLGMDARSAPRTQADMAKNRGLFDSWLPREGNALPTLALLQGAHELGTEHG